MKKKTPTNETKKTPKTYPVPQWMDETLKPLAQTMDTLERHTLADKLERQAEQLRELKPPAVPWDTTVALLRLRPNMKRALLFFAKQHGADEKYDEQTKLQLGIRWFLESALPLLDLVSKQTRKQVHYRNAEGLEDSVYIEKLISDALAEYEKQFEADEE